MDIIPGLKGFGTDTRAAYAAVNPPEICVVNSLLTTTGSPSWNSSYGPNGIGVFEGTLIQCMNSLDTLNGETIDSHVVAPNSGKIILFEVSGTINQTGTNGTSAFRYDIGNNTSVHGQTSPNPGILLRNIAVYGGDVHDVLIQHIRGRMDGPPTTDYGTHKSFNFPVYSGSHNIVFDHLSTAWGGDGNICFYKSSGTVGDMYNITISNCILAESRESMGLIDEEANNGKNMLLGGSNSRISNTYNILISNNLFSNTKKRNPRLYASAVALINNHIYNNYEYGTMLVGENGPMDMALVGNVLEGGPMSVGTSTKDAFPMFMNPDWATPLSDNHVYLYDNVADTGTQTNSSDWLAPGFKVQTVPGPGTPTNIYNDIIGGTFDVRTTGETPSINAPIWPVGFNLLSSGDVKNSIQTNVGAYPAFRDSLDLRFIDEAMTGTGPASRVTGSPASGDWPVLTENVTTLSIPANPHVDSGDGYTNLEKWLHTKAAEVEGTGTSHYPYTRSRGIMKPQLRFNSVGRRFM